MAKSRSARDVMTPTRRGRRRPAGDLHAVMCLIDPGSGLVLLSSYAAEMTKHECRMTKELRSPNDEGPHLGFRHSSLIRISSFGFCYSRQHSLNVPGQNIELEIE